MVWLVMQRCRHVFNTIILFLAKLGYLPNTTLITADSLCRIYPKIIKYDIGNNAMRLLICTFHQSPIRDVLIQF